MESRDSPRTSLLILGAGLLAGLALGLLIFFGVPALEGGGLPRLSLPGGPTATPAPAPVVGAPAPDFTLVDLAGNAVALSGLRGRPILINFWATWCGQCRVEMPAIEQRWQRYQSQGLVVLAVDAGEPAAVVQDFVTAYGLTFTVLLDPDFRVNDLYRVRGYPTSYFVDRAGIVQALQIGSLTERQLDDYLARIGLTG